MRLLALALLALPALLSTGASAQATLNKCIDAQGRITYSNLPCRDAREARKRKSMHRCTIPNATPPGEPAKPAAPKAASSVKETATLRLDTQRTTGKPAARLSARQCDALTDKLGRVFDKMDQARRKGYTQEQMNTWNQEIKDLERQKRQSGCF